MADSNKLKRLIQKKGEYERRIERLKKNLADLDVERRDFIEETAFDENTSKKEVMYTRKNRGLIKRLDNLQTDLKRAEESLQFVKDSILEESAVVQKVMNDELERESLEKQALYETENEFILNQKAELAKRVEGLSTYHREARQARDLHHSISKFWSPEKISMVVENPGELKSQLNPTLAKLLQVEDEYLEACQKEQKEHEKELERVKKQEAKTIEHRKSVWNRAIAMYERKEIPDDLWTKYGNRANPTVIFNYLLSQEGVANA
jgi:hypothetical protein